jgi:hypothetical protein
MASIALGNTYWSTALQRRIPAGVFARVRSYDILVSFVFMPIGFVAFPLISKTLGVEPTLLGAAAVATATCLATALVPGVRAITDEVVPPLTPGPAVPVSPPRSGKGEPGAGAAGA